MASATAAALPAGAPDLEDIVGYMKQVLTSTNTELAQQQELIGAFRQSWDCAGVTIGELEITYVTRVAESFSKEVVSRLLGRPFHSTDGQRSSTAETYGELLFLFFEAWPRTSWMTAAWTRLVRIVSAHNGGEETLWATDELTYFMAVFAWKHRSLDSYVGSNNDDEDSDSENELDLCTGFEKMEVDMAWKMRRSDHLDEDSAKAISKRYVRALGAAGMDHRKLTRIFHQENEDTFKSTMWAALSTAPSSSSSLRDPDKKRFVQLLVWYLRHARMKEMPKGWSAVDAARRQ